jgi:hypothetical protein
MDVGRQPIPEHRAEAESGKLAVTPRDCCSLE